MAFILFLQAQVCYSNSKTNKRDAYQTTTRNAREQKKEHGTDVLNTRKKKKTKGKNKDCYSRWST